MITVSLTEAFTGSGKLLVSEADFLSAYFFCMSAVARTSSRTHQTGCSGVLEGAVLHAAGAADVCHAGLRGRPGAAVALCHGARLHPAPGVPQRSPWHRAAIAVSLCAGAGAACLWTCLLCGSQPGRDVLHVCHAIEPRCGPIHSESPPCLTCLAQPVRRGSVQVKHCMVGAGCS